ncbi:MAG: TetR/AcrR family transcriptional regulator [bacterium]|nr:TetR/AcrR family transcriptional regulator [bacterium]
MTKHEKLSTKDKLLQVAIDEFAEYGYDGVSTRSLASKAGVNNYAISYHFGSKRDLYTTCMVSLIEQYETDCKHITDEVNFALENNLDTTVWASLLKKFILFHIKLFISNKTRSRYLFGLRLKLSDLEENIKYFKNDPTIYPLRIIIQKMNNLDERKILLINQKCLNIVSFVHSLITLKEMILEAFDYEDYTPEFIEEYTEYLFDFAKI